ncbi:senescence associated gene 20-like [Cicer arietinum]|uniref:Senescence associated gene 20-like n=1 Tax=Cicer arietinum TaxID=3827 RepID=A0A1S2XKE1_CICAR|nr:senescence associated gene 20-like [Cicer arietinum]
MVMPIEKEDHNKKLVTDLYKALVTKDTNTMQNLLASDLEWWFHGPPCHSHYLVSYLTCSSSSSKKSLVPNIIIGFGSVIVAEGFDEENKVWWVHAWSICNGIITEVREYVNTSLTVTKLGNLHFPMSQSVVSKEDVVGSTCRCIWQSKLCDESVPGLILTV